MGNLRHVIMVAVMALVVVMVSAGGADAAAPKALIDGDTVSGSPSQEEAIATSLGYAVTVVSDATWGAMTASEFGQYDLLTAGDPTCATLPPGLGSSAAVYGSVVLGLAGGRTSAGNRIEVGTDPVYHDGGDYTSPGARGTIIREGIAYAGSKPGTTGMYFDASCGANLGDPAQAAETLSILDSLSAGSGAWTIDADPPCGGSVSLIASNPAFADLTTASLQGWGCSVHESFPTFKSDWSALAVATDTASHPTCGVDPGTGLGACGEAYILIAGSAIVVNSLVISVSPLDASNPVGTSHTVTANVHAPGGTPVVAGQQVDFTVTGQNAGASGSCVPLDCKSDVNGNVSFTYSDGNGAGDDTIKASFTDSAGSLQTATAQKHWVAGSTSPTTLTVDPATGDFADATTVSAVLTKTSDASPVAGKSVTLTLNAIEQCTATTDATGTATCQLTPGEAAGTYPLAGSFGGDADFASSSGSASFVVTHEETSLSYTGDTSAVNGNSITLSGTLTTDDPSAGTALGGKTVLFTLGSGGSAQSCSGATDTSGSASCTIGSVSQPVGPVPIAASFAGDSFYQSATATSSADLFPPTGLGAFVIGDRSTSGTVYFWGSQWAMKNSLSGGAAPSAMKGFADSPTPSLTCGATFTTLPGDSSAPPSSLPSQIEVIVTSKVTKKGSTISGTISHIVTVNVNPGYGNAPGHLGTGTIVGTIC